VHFLVARVLEPNARPLPAARHRLSALALGESE